MAFLAVVKGLILVAICFYGDWRFITRLILVIAAAVATDCSIDFVYPGTGAFYQGQWIYLTLCLVAALILFCSELIEASNEEENGEN